MPQKGLNILDKHRKSNCAYFIQFVKNILG